MKPNTLNYRRKISNVAITMFREICLKAVTLRDQKSEAAKDKWPFRTDSFHWECTAEDKKQTG
jgi:hypothetical protein